MAQELNLAGRKLVQVALTVTDLDRARNFYRDTLGLPLLFEAGHMLFFDAGGTRLMVGLAEQKDKPVGGTYIYFDAGDWSATEQALESRGLKFERPAEIVQRAEGKEHALRFFKDPDGNALAIMGWRDARKA